MTEDGPRKPLPHSMSVTGVADLFDAATPTLAKNIAPPSPYATVHTNLSPSAQVLFCTDEWFARAENLFQAADPVFDPEAYCPQGKVMDGWESRRRREAGHDFLVAQLKGSIRALEIDTAHFTGNHVPQISIQVATLTKEQELRLVQELPNAVERLLQGGGRRGTGMTPAQVQQAETVCQDIPWRTLLERTRLQPGYEDTRMHYFDINPEQTVTHVRINYFPDGGVARLKFWGTAQPLPTPLPYSPIVTGRTCSVYPYYAAEQPRLTELEGLTQVSAAAAGGIALSCTNKHYGDPCNLIQAGVGVDMGDGWETARHTQRPAILQRNPSTGLVQSDLQDAAVLQLARPCVVQAVVLDTHHFWGNYPESVQVQACCSENDDDLTNWVPLVARGRMAPDSVHVYAAAKGQLCCEQTVTHIKVTVYPDGGLSRVRIYG